MDYQYNALYRKRVRAERVKCVSRCFELSNSFVKGVFMYVRELFSSVYSHNVVLQVLFVVD
jgi:hypothetical protein